MQNSAVTNFEARRDHRIAAILALPEAEGREDLAQALATTTDLSVDQINAVLASAPLSADRISAMWDDVFKSRGMKVGGAKAGADPWDRVLRAKGMIA